MQLIGALGHTFLDEAIHPLLLTCLGSLGAHGGTLISQVHRAAKLYFAAAKDKPSFPDVTDSKTHFLRPASRTETTFRVSEIAVGRTSATVEVRVLQAGKTTMIALLAMGDFARMRGPDLATGSRLLPPPSPASIELLETDNDPNWASLQLPWQPDGYLRLFSHIKFFLPRPLPHLSLWDHWLTPNDADAAFRYTNDHLPFVADMTFPMTDNLQPGGGPLGEHARILAVCEAQRADRAAGRAELSPGPAGKDAVWPQYVCLSLNFNMEVKKKLPDEGVKWLFTRCRARQIRQGRMDNECTILDEHGDIVAVVHHVLQVLKADANPLPKEHAKPSAKM